MNHMPATIHAHSPAKLNLFLHITGQRPDGYHELQTIFQLIDLYDEISFSINLNNQITLNHIEQIHPEQNLIYRAAQQLLPYRQNQQYGCDIQIQKNIPMGAGLGGGSSNAATTLLVLNKLWQCQCSQSELLTIAQQLGADVPIFIYGKNAWAEGIGEKITLLPNLPKNCYIILKPDCFISTQLLFSQKTLTRDTKPSIFAAYQDNPTQFGNNFEAIARNLYPTVEQAFQYLNQFGQAKLTGTGACVFLDVTYLEDIKSDDIREILKHAPCQAYLAHSIDQSPVITQLEVL